MPRFIPVQCHKCSVLQIKPSLNLGVQWCCSTCRPKAPSDSESQVAALDVSLFVEELFEEAEEMGAVANTFRGVESLDCAFYWEGLYYQSSKVQHQQAPFERKCSVNPIQMHEDDFTKVAEVDENRVSKRKSWEMGQSPFLSSLWGRWQQKAAKEEVVELVELMEFAGGLGNEENVLPFS